jgi:hypothetical protein
VREFFRDWLESFDSYRADAESFAEVADKVVVGYRVTGRGKGSGVDVEMLRWNVYEVGDGLVTRVEIFGSEADALAAARRVQ